MHPFKSISCVSPRPGTRLVVLGAVHGDETCGTRAIERVVAELDAATLTLVIGKRPISIHRSLASRCNDELIPRHETVARPTSVRP